MDPCKRLHTSDMQSQHAARCECHAYRTQGQPVPKQIAKGKATAKTLVHSYGGTSKISTCRAGLKRKTRIEPIGCPPDLLSIQILCSSVDALIHFKDPGRICVVFDYAQAQYVGPEDVHKGRVFFLQVCICLAIWCLQNLKPLQSRLQ